MICGYHRFGINLKMNGRRNVIIIDKESHSGKKITIARLPNFHLNLYFPNNPIWYNIIKYASLQDRILM